MNGGELALAFLAGVAMNIALDRWMLPLRVDAWIDRLRRLGDEKGDDGRDRRRTDDGTLLPSWARSSRSWARGFSLPAGREMNTVTALLTTA